MTWAPWLLALFWAFTSIVDAQSGYQLNCLVNGRYINATKRSDGNLIANNGRALNPTAENPFSYGFSLCVGRTPDDPWSGCGRLADDSPANDLFVSRLADRARFATPTELNLAGLLNSIVSITPVSVMDRYFLSKRVGSGVNFDTTSIDDRECWVIVPNADGSVSIRTLSTYPWPVTAGALALQAGNDSNVKDDVYADNMPTSITEQFFLQPIYPGRSGGAVSYYLVNRKYCTALSYTGDITVAKPSTLRGADQQMIIKPYTPSTMSRLHNPNEYSKPVPPVPASAMFDRCNWISPWIDTTNTGNILSIWNSRKRLFLPILSVSLTCI